MIMKECIPFSVLGVLLGIFLLLLQTACATSPRFPESVLDTPELHVSNGFKLLQKDRFEDAEREFRNALRHNPSYARAYSGMGLVSAYGGDYASAFQFMEKARVLAGTKEEEFQVYVGWIRLHTAQKRGELAAGGGKVSYTGLCPHEGQIGGSLLHGARVQGGRGV